MKKFQKAAIAFATIIVCQFTFAQQGAWKELQTFHSVMARTFHPSEEGNLKPVKENAGDLLAKAKEWQASAIPADFNPEQTQKVLAELVAKCEEIDKAVKAEMSNEELKKLIGEAHETFHHLVEKCRKP